MLPPQEDDMTLEQAVATLEFKGYEVWRMDFPRPPFPGLYRIAGHPEMTEAQVIEAAEALPHHSESVLLVGWRGDA
jgi:hypothetical protein